MGFFFDCVAFSYLAIPFVLYLAVIPDRIFNHSWHKPLVGSVLYIVISAFVFNVASEYLFFDEFGTRYNFIAVDYLVYTREVIGNIKESYPLVPIFIGIFAAATAIFALVRNLVRDAFTGTSSLAQRLRVGLVFAVLPVLSFLFVDLSLTSISGNSYANEIAGNGVYDLFAAFRNNELDYNRFYVTGDQQAVLAQVRSRCEKRTTSMFRPTSRQ